MRSKFAALVVAKLLRATMAALFTTASMRPNAASAAATIRAGLAGSSKSSKCSTAAAPNFPTTASPSARSIPCTNTRAPSATARSAIACPIPDVPPVTMITFPFSLID